MANRPVREPAPTTSTEFDHGEVVEVALLLRAADMADLEARATRKGVTTGQLIRHVICGYLSALEGSCRETFFNHHGETT
jgi:hypothetical protein